MDVGFESGLKFPDLTTLYNPWSVCMLTSMHILLVPYSKMSFKNVLVWEEGLIIQFPPRAGG